MSHQKQSKHVGSSLNSFFDKEGMKEEVDALTRKKIQAEEILEIGFQMKQEGLSGIFVLDCIKTAMEFNGTFKMMALWRDEAEDEEKAEVIADLKEMIRDTKGEAQHTPE